MKKTAEQMATEIIGAFENLTYAFISLNHGFIMVEGPIDALGLSRLNTSRQEAIRVVTEALLRSANQYRDDMGVE